MKKIFHFLLLLTFTIISSYSLNAQKSLAKEAFSKARSYELELEDEEAIKWYHKAAELGHPLAQYKLGDYYLLEVEDDGKAAYWYRKSAEQGYVKAQYDLAEMYSWGGEGIDEDVKLAIYWYQLAAEQGHERAPYYLGLSYEHGGDGVPGDIETAVYWYRKAAELGDESAIERLKELGY